MKVLVIGGSGLLGMEVTGQARLAGHNVLATYHSSLPAVADVDWRSLDIRQRNDPLALVVEYQPDAVINAAYRQSDWLTTADGAMHVAAAAAAAQARLFVTPSTRSRYARRHCTRPSGSNSGNNAAATPAANCL